MKKDRSEKSYLVSECMRILCVFDRFAWYHWALHVIHRFDIHSVRVPASDDDIHKGRSQHHASICSIDYVWYIALRHVHLKRSGPQAKRKRSAISTSPQWKISINIKPFFEEIQIRCEI